jgi:hypothetical protein
MLPVSGSVSIWQLLVERTLPVLSDVALSVWIEQSSPASMALAGSIDAGLSG